MPFHRRPDGDLRGIGHQELDDGPFLARLFDVKKVHAGNPAVRDGLVESLALALADNDLEAVVLEVEGLARTLDAVTDDGDGFVLEDFAGFCEGEFFTGDDVLVDAAEIDCCHMLLVVDLFLFLFAFPEEFEDRFLHGL